jgi:CBS domain containing-hemolysin-like protein/mannitol/fructose-specific phosphotransferase system IIA component (Ntr-type)
MLLFYIGLLVVLLVLNAFFVLAEFAAVRVRGTQISAMRERRPREAKLLRHIHERLDEYLSVCQLGITFASIGLGFVGEPAIARLIEPLLGNTTAAHAIAIGISYILVSFLHILLSEQLPKCIAIRFSEKSALLTALPMIWSRRLLYLPHTILNGSAILLLKLLGLHAVSSDMAPSEAEVRIILDKFQQEGVMSFRRLLLMENVFDFGSVRVRDEMRQMSQITALYTDQPWEENRNKILTTTFSRYPLLEGQPPRALGVVHLKDLLFKDTPWPDPVDLKAIARKTYLAPPDMPLEQLLTELRRRRIHMALVQDAQGALCGLITMEDILEQLVGAIEDEFEREAPLRLGDVLREDRVLLDLQAGDSMAAIAEILNRVPTDDLPANKAALIEAVQARERSLTTYLGEDLAVPHARLENLKNAVMCFARAPAGVVFDPAKPDEKAHMLFLLLTPAAAPRLQTKLLARLANLRESTYVWDRLAIAATPAATLEAIRSGDELST